jgi:UDPglucose 6-dehydrogenase
VALYGFSYKKNTSDTRSTPSVSIISKLLEGGLSVSVHDPKVSETGFRIEMDAQGVNWDKVEFCG